MVVRRRKLCTVTCLLGVCGFALGASGQVGQWDFLIDSAQSGLNASPALEVNTAGNLIGDWDAVSNPGGTRTKPGLFGSFGATENVGVPMTLGASLGGAISSDISGGFGATIDAGAGVISLSGYNADLLSQGPVSLPFNVSLLFETFRTRAPDSTFIGGFPLSVPVGQATLSELRVEQVGAGAPGVLTPTGVPGEFTFVVAPVVSLTATLEVFGQVLEAPGVPVPLPLTGTLVLSGESAVLASMQMLEFSQEVPVDQALGAIPFPLPTILPPGGTANVLMNLVLQSIGAELVGEQSLRATGVLIPAPGSIACLAMGGVVCARRRRRGG